MAISSRSDLSVHHKEYVIYRVLMDCYDHAVHLLECFIPVACNPTFLTTHAARFGVVIDCHANAEELTVPYRSVNPATGEVLKTFTEHTDQGMMDALATADNAFVSWAAHPIEERAKIISRAAQLLDERKTELAKLATLEMGKRIAESRGGVELSAAILQYFAVNAVEFLAPKPFKSTMGDDHLEFSPVGVLLSIQPWN